MRGSSRSDWLPLSCVALKVLHSVRILLQRNDAQLLHFFSVLADMPAWMSDNACPTDHETQRTARAEQQVHLRLRSLNGADRCGVCVCVCVSVALFSYDHARATVVSREYAARPTYAKCPCIPLRLVRVDDGHTHERKFITLVEEI